MNPSNETFRKIVHDLRAPMINASGFSEELREAFDSLKVLFEFNADQIPEEIHAHISEILVHEISPNLSYLLAAVRQLDEQLDSVAERYREALGRGARV